MSDQKNRITEVAQVFFRLGLIAFGGPAAHVAMMEDEVVTKRKWMDRQHFLDLMGATNLIPGPNSTEMTMHCGHERAGRVGLFVAGASFILPAVVLTGILAWLYVEYGSLPQVEPFIFGIKPAVIAIIASAIYKLGQKAVKGIELAVLGVVCLGAVLLGLNELIALLGTGILGTFYFYTKQRSGLAKQSVWPLLLLQVGNEPIVSVSTLKIFWSFLKVGAVLYGSGYVLFAYLDAELVSRGWLTQQQLMDAIAIGQFTPGPVLSTATFIGYQLGGLAGAVAATVGVFLPSFLFVLVLNPLIPKMRKSKLLSYFLDSVNVAAVAVMVAVVIKMGMATLTDWRTILIALMALAVVFGYKKANAMLLVLGGSLLGRVLLMIDI